VTPPSPRDERSAGLGYALAAYLSWGLLPVYFKALKHVSALEILAHRVVWSLALLALLLAVRGGRGAFTAPFRGGRWAILALTTGLISSNWLIYIWAVNSGRVVEASLGYFMNPLVNVLLGVAFLGETLSGRQRAAIALAAIGVVVLVLRAGTFPWVSVLLAISFGLYGLVRKRAAIDAIGGLIAETALLAPLALAFLGGRAASGVGAFGSAPGTSALLAAAGVITALPLVWFTLAVHRLRLSTMGLVQYIAPTGQFLLGVALYREPFTRAHAAAFGLIWASLALYTWDALSRVRMIER
jgi:chloramphenicol-sensitive protein RarD